METELLMQKAAISIREMETGKIFVVKDLFVGKDWNSLLKGDRQNFGRYFKNEIMNGTFPCVRYIGKQSNNSACYVKDH